MEKAVSPQNAPAPTAEAVFALQREVLTVCANLKQLLLDALNTFGDHEPDLRPSLEEIDALCREAVDVFGRRYQGIKMKLYGNRIESHALEPRYIYHSTDKVPSLPDWTAQIKKELDSLKDAPLPFWAQDRGNEYVEVRDKLLKLLEPRYLIEQQFCLSAMTRFRAEGERAVRAHLAARASDVSALCNRVHQLIPAGIGPINGDALVHGDASGVTQLLTTVGQVQLAPVSLGLRAVDPTDSSRNVYADMFAEETFAYDLPVKLPLILDLARDGGLVTDSLATVNNVLLRLLARLPAGRVSLCIFDPLHLGGSASILFNLGESAAAVIGDKVRTSERELSDLLVEMEDHITFVTQKYLQGTYETLDAYNHAAGEISEPYRILVLYDYPSGFSHSGGQFDIELLSRLGKIVSVGPRCGVFTVATSSKGGLHGNGPLGTLPWLWTDLPIESHWPMTLLFGNLNEQLEFLLVRGEILERQQSGPRVSPLVPLIAWRIKADLRFRPEAELPRPVTTAILAHVHRDLALASDIRVTPTRVAELARARLAKGVALGIQAPETLPEPDNRATWWHGSTADEVSSAFARVGADDVGVLRFDSRTFSGALIGGRPGAGKSVLLHAIIGSLTTRYSPDELELYLVDFKEGVEFKIYAAAGLPHARVVAIESDREFGLSVLEALDLEITHRGELFRRGAGEQVDIGAYRRRTGEPLPRILLVIDEFHVLFERDDKLATRAAELLDRIVRQGRAFGVHTILASQTLAGTIALGKHTLNQIPIRIALQCSETDSRLLLADDNPDARLLTHPGEGILNTLNGLRDANLRFQASYTAAEERSALVAELRGLADSRSYVRRPVVFEAHLPISVTDVPASTFQKQRSPNVLDLPLGLPLTLGGPVAAELRREPGGNLLVVTPDDQAYPCLSVILTTLAATGVETFVCDYGDIDAPWSPILERLSGPQVSLARRRDVTDTLHRIAKSVDERHNLREYRNRPQVLMLAGLHRAREFDAEANGEESELLERILRDGPEVGVHVICWCDRPLSLQRRISSGGQREMGIRLVGQMSKDDSFQLIDSDLAAHLNPSQFVLDDHDRATTTRLRRFDMPTPVWVEQTVRGGDNG